MNETELDQLLNTWEAPMPPRTLRSNLRDRFPRAERRWFGRPLRWVLVGVVACATLAVGMEQSSGSSSLDFLFMPIRRLVTGVIEGIAIRQAAAIRNQIRDADPKVFVDGQPAGSITYKGGATMWIEVPGDGTFVIAMYPPHQGGWVEAGRLHDRVLEFQAGSKQVRIECNKSVVDADHAVYAIHLP